ncbi:MAG: ParB/RepB/Spo0J family partition protein [Eubacteriales bacterium]
MKQEKGLGRGLDSLLGETESESNLATVSIEKVQPDSNQPRKYFSPQQISDLADSIRTHGILQPISVRKLSSGYYQIIAGDRRWRAAREAGLEEVPVIVIEADDRKVMELALIENLQREDLNPVEVAKGYQALMDEYGLTQEEVSQSMGKPRSSIANSLRLLGLGDKILPLVAEGKISSGHGKVLLSAPNTRLMEELADTTVQKRLSVRQLEGILKAKTKEEKPPKEVDQSILIYLQDAERKLTEALGRKVMIETRGKKGKIVLEYYDAHDLETLIETLEVVGDENQ